MHESRLFKIIYFLLDKGQATASELAEEFEVSSRTIYRDIDALSAAGIPVYTEAGRNGGIYLLNDFVLDKALLCEDEKQEILTAMQSVNIARNLNSSQTIQKLSALFNTNADNWLEVDFSGWGNSGFDSEKFEDLKSAVQHRNYVQIHYAGVDNVIKERTVRPLKLLYKSKAWYLEAFCTEKQDIRLFKLSRILELLVLNKTFVQQSYERKQIASEQKYNKIVLRFPEEMAYRVYDEFDKTQIARQKNGDLLVTAEMPEDMWLIGFLLSFAAQVEIISPAYLKDAVAQQAKLIYEKYKT